MDWFRLWHGTTTDPKFRLIAQECATETGKVLALWLYILETSSQSDDRGSMSSFNPKLAACLLDFPLDIISQIESCMVENGLITNGRIAKWDNRQPARQDVTNADRQRRFREKQRSDRNAPVTRYVTQRNDTDTDTDTDINNLARSSYTPTFINSFEKPLPPEKPLIEDIGEYKFMDYAQLFVDDMPNMLKNPQNRSRCGDLFKDWHTWGVTPKDVSQAIVWKKSDGGVVTVPWFYEQIALEFANARRQNRDPRPYKKKTSDFEHVMDIFKKLDERDRLNDTS